MNCQGQQKDVNLLSPCQRLQWLCKEGYMLLKTQTERIFRRAVVPRVFFRLQLGQSGISFQPLTDHYLVVALVVQLRQVMKDS